MDKAYIMYYIEVLKDYLTSDEMARNTLIDYKNICDEIGFFKRLLTNLNIQ